MTLPDLGGFAPLVFVAAFVACAVLGMFIAARASRRRDAQRQVALASVAAELGMGFTPEDGGLLHHFGGYAFFPHGDWPRATSVMRGTIGDVTTVLFDYHVTTGSHNNRHMSQVTVAAFDLAARPLPVFEAHGGRQGRVMQALDTALGGERIDFPDDPAFTRGFRVTGQDEQRVRQLLGPGARAVLLRRAEWMFRSNGRWLLMCHMRKRPGPTEFRAFVEQASEAMRAMTGAGV